MFKKKKIVVNAHPALPPPKWCPCCGSTRNKTLHCKYINFFFSILFFRVVRNLYTLLCKTVRNRCKKDNVGSFFFLFIVRSDQIRCFCRDKLFPYLWNDDNLLLLSVIHCVLDKWSIKKILKYCSITIALTLAVYNTPIMR